MAESLPHVGQRIAELTERMAQANSAPPSWELSSDREVTASDETDHVTVTIRNFEVASVWIDPGWASERFGDTEAIEKAFAQATNTALAQFLKAELDEAMDTHYGIDGVAQQMRTLSADVNAAFGAYLDDAMGRMPR